MTLTATFKLNEVDADVMTRLFDEWQAEQRRIMESPEFQKTETKIRRELERAFANEPLTIERVTETLRWITHEPIDVSVSEDGMVHIQVAWPAGEVSA